MVHKAEVKFSLAVNTLSIAQLVNEDFSSIHNSDVIFLHFPLDLQEHQLENPQEMLASETYRFCQLANLVSKKIKNGAKFIVLGNVEQLPYIHEFLDESLKYQHWIAVRLAKPRYRKKLPNEHVGLTIYTKNLQVLYHSKVRIAYEYCKFCDKTTKDYGGKKHLYHEYGTLMSDVWKDIEIHQGDISDIIQRIRDMFSIKPNKKMLVIPVSSSTEIELLNIEHLPVEKAFPKIQSVDSVKEEDPNLLDYKQSSLYNGDAIAFLKRIPDNSIDLAFADPPYNLQKKYRGYKDELEIDEYFRWCDLWLEHLVRVLKPGGSLVIVNIPLWSIRHFLYLQQRLCLQNWIVWESLSMPVRFIMPSHYTLLFYTKGKEPRTFNYAYLNTKGTLSFNELEDNFLYPLSDGYCLRSSCIRKRRKTGLYPKKELTDLWTDISRIKHNSRRADHPCQLPPKLMKRLILLLTNANDIVLDCFNGVGTSSLTAHQLGRRYLGIEVSSIYHKIALDRHRLILGGSDPFAKRKKIPTDKNSPIPRTRKTKYAVSKKKLQLDVKRIAKKLGHIPSRSEVKQFSKYEINYFDSYFRNWSEVVAAARTTGMSETRKNKKKKQSQTTLF